MNFILKIAIKILPLIGLSKASVVQITFIPDYEPVHHYTHRDTLGPFYWGPEDGSGRWFLDFGPVGGLWSGDYLWDDNLLKGIGYWSEYGNVELLWGPPELSSWELNSSGELTYSDKILISSKELGGASGWLDILATNSAPQYQIKRFVFDDQNPSVAPPDFAPSDSAYPEFFIPTPIPEPSANVALMALGTVGLMLRCRFKVRV